ncbi:MAG: hypothetical protein C0597_03100 [Marinilabiliales bacterium]|nr:MAG: hypothetical protein C0597_03100 [Marinilabiliales bacterium]
MANDQFLYLVNDNIIIVEKNTLAKDHHHHAIKIAITFGHKPILYFNNKLVKQNTLVYDSDWIHSFETKDTWSIILLLNPDSEIGAHIRTNILKHNKVYFTNIEYDKHLINHFNDLKTKILSKKIVDHIYHEIILKTCGAPSDKFLIDRRIRKVFDEIKHFEEKKISAKDLASLAYLSESRFMHLFKEEVKIPVRQYLLWLKLIDAIKLILRGESFTIAAMDSGFTDLPHLHKTFTHFFGVKLNEYLGKEKSLQFKDYSR